MTRKDYILIAKVLALHNDGSANFERLINSFSKELLIDNPRFDDEKFASACSVLETEPFKALQFLNN